MLLSLHCSNERTTPGVVPSTLGRFPCRRRGSCLGCQQGL